MAKIVLSDIAASQLSTQNALNNNFQSIEDELNDNVLYRNNPAGEPNQLETAIDMNSNRVINLAKPVGDNDAVRKIDTSTLVLEDSVIELKDETEVFKNKAEEWANNPEDTAVETGKFSALHHAAKASASATNAATSETNVSSFEAKAQEWAENPEDTAVETGKFSALHHSAKSATSATDASASEAKAQEWAESPEDTEVETGKFSALHHSAKAAESAAGVDLPAITSGDAGKLLQVNAGETSHVLVEVPSGRRNILLNGKLNVNQRGFGGDWGTLSNGEYGYDRWKREDASNITQVVEAGNFVPSTTYTLSGTNVTTQQLTSPASGNWAVSVPNTADNVQLELGSVATSFDQYLISGELELCKRYYEKGRYFAQVQIDGTTDVSIAMGPTQFSSSKPANPTYTFTADGSTSGATSVSAGVLDTEGFNLQFTATQDNGIATASGSWTAEAEL